MKLLLIADTPSKYLWDYYEEGKLKDYDLILSAGDLPSEYLSFLVTFAKCPLLYVRGNHDTYYDRKPPEGCICVEDTVYTYKGLRILGLGGSMRYRPGTCQYTNREMEKRIRRLKLRLWRTHGFDILLTHAPVRGVNDMEDTCHQGFAAFDTLLERCRPSYMVHGHVHLNYGFNVPRVTPYKGTRIINAYERYDLDTEEM